MDIYRDYEWVMWIEMAIVIVMLALVGVVAYEWFGFKVAVYAVATSALVNAIPVLIVEHILRKAGFEEALKKGGKSE